MVPRLRQLLAGDHRRHDHGGHGDVQQQLGDLLVRLPAQVPQPVGRIARRNGEQDDQHLAKYVPKIHLSLSPLIIPEFGSYATRVQAERALAAAWRPMDVHRVPVRS